MSAWASDKPALGGNIKLPENMLVTPTRIELVFQP